MKSMGTSTDQRRSAVARRRGGALVFALIIAVTVAAASAGIIYFTMHFTRRQVHTVHDQRAFYLAEAGLGEAYQALASGQSGQIGSMDGPAGAGQGLLWVDATPNADGTVLLESTALVGLGRSALSLLVERVEQPLGIFADEDLVIAGPVLVDGYDSAAAPYAAQVQQRGTIKVPKSLTEPDTDELVPFAEAELVDFFGVEFLVVGGDDTSYFLELYDSDDADMYTMLQELDQLYRGNAPIDEMDIDWLSYDLELLEKVGYLGWVDAQELLGSEPIARELDLAWAEEEAWALGADELEPAFGGEELLSSEKALLEEVLPLHGSHTAGGGKLASNGSVEFQSHGVEIYGDVVPGPGGEVRTSSGTYITGSTLARPKAIELTHVTAPDVELGPALSHSGAAPLLIPPSVLGYEGLTVVGDAEVIVRGPSTLLIGDLLMDPGAHLSIENLDGPVDLFVLRSAELALGSSIDVASTDPGQLTLRFVGDASPISLDATSQFHGMVYGPAAEICLGAPFEVYGALIGRKLQLGAGARLHFDTGLAGEAGRLPLPKLVSWDVTEVPASIKSRRLDAFEALGVERVDLEPPADSVETFSWTARITYSNWFGEDEVYDGPFEEWDPGGADGWPTLETMTAPDVAFGTPWQVHIEYSYMFRDKVYDGDLGTVPKEALYYIKSMTITPPPELLDAGREPTTWVR